MAYRDFPGRRVLVTGASSGIGRAVARELARQRARVLLTARRESLLRELVDELRGLGAEADYVVGDVADAATRQRLVERVASTWGGLDVLINNAGVGAVGPFAEATEQRLRQVMEVNFFAPAELTRAMLPWLRRGDRPLVVNVGSILSRVAMPKKSEYCASKFALRGWNHALQAELRPEGIQVLLVGPNTTRSEFFDRLLDQHGPVAKNPWSTPPETVARRLLRAARRRNSQELMLTFSGRALILLDFCCPALLRHLLARWG
jgi:short-subunit dehydrogenase